MADRGRPLVATGAREARVAYGAALLLLVVSVVVTVGSTGSRGWLSVAGILQGLALLVTLRVSGARRRGLVAVSALALVTMATAVGLIAANHPFAPTVAPALWAVVAVGTIAAIGRHLVTFGRVDLQAVLGLLSIYVLFGLLFAYIFMLIEAAGGQFFADGTGDPGSYVYFSYVTLATVGYGDLTAAPGWPRALVVAEMITGQLYLVGVVALAVSRFSGGWQR